MAMAYQMAEYSRANDELEEKKIQHYSSFQHILLVGEGDFSFSLCLAQAFGSAFNITASSLQSYDEVIKMFKNGKLNLENLKAFGGTVLHGVDATNMKLHPYLRNWKFDRIIFNFPHAGFRGSEDITSVIQTHKDLLAGFFGSARERLRPDGEIHVTHRTDYPYNLWDIVGLASKNYLTLIERAHFNIANYHGYNNKRGAYPDCDESFPLGQCCTFKFILDPSQNMQRMHYLNVPSQGFQEIPNSISPPIHPFWQQLSLTHSRNSPTYVNGMNAFSSYASLQARRDTRSKFFRLFKDYFSYVQRNFGREGVTAVEFSVRQALLQGSLMYREESERHSENYLVYVEMLRCWSLSRLTRLQQMLQDPTRRVCEPQDIPYHL